MKIFIVVLRIVVRDVFRRLKFEGFLFEHLLLWRLLVVAGPLHCLLVYGWVGVVHGRVPRGHWLAVDRELLRPAGLRGGVAPAHHGSVVGVLDRHAPAPVHLLGDHALGSGHHGDHGLVRHGHTDTGALAGLPGGLGDTSVRNQSFLFLVFSLHG